MNRFRSYDGTTIAFHDDGSGPAVMLLHGYGLDGLGNFGDFEHSRSQFERTLALWRTELGPAPPMPDPPVEGRPGLISRLLAAGARTIAVDLRGFGESDKPRDRAAYANAAMARDVEALIGHLGLESVDVLGYSMGAGAATGPRCPPSEVSCSRRDWSVRLEGRNSGVSRELAYPGLPPKTVDQSGLGGAWGKRAGTRRYRSRQPGFGAHHHGAGNRRGPDCARGCNPRRDCRRRVS